MGPSGRARDDGQVWLGLEKRRSGVGPGAGSPNVSLGLDVHPLCSGRWIWGSKRLLSLGPLLCFWVLCALQPGPFAFITSHASPVSPRSGPVPSHPRCIILGLCGFSGPMCTTRSWPLAFSRPAVTPAYASPIKLSADEECFPLLICVILEPGSHLAQGIPGA